MCAIAVDAHAVAVAVAVAMATVNKCDELNKTHMYSAL